MVKQVAAVLLIGIFFTRTLANGRFFEEEGQREEKLVNRFNSLLGRYLRREENRHRGTRDEFENWTGRWMPDRPGDPTPPPKVVGKSWERFQQDYALHSFHGIPMGQLSDDCDNAKTNLTVDWDRSPVNHTCYDSKITPDRATIPLKYCERIQKGYVALHKCMYETIEYDDDIPIFGAHRPLWPVYGEYKFLPKQRWLHSLEHGAIVMLHHPCANPLEVKRLRSLVTGCLWRHVITPYNLLPEDRPLALLSWGCRLTMSYVNPKVVTKFIREHALRGPEETAKDGDFRDELRTPAKLVTDTDDSTLCPNFPHS